MDELIDLHLKAEAAGDPSGCVAMYTEDVVHDVAGWPSGPGKGIAAAKDFYDHLTKDIRTETMTPVHRWHGSDFAVIEHHWTGTVPGPSSVSLGMESGSPSGCSILGSFVTAASVERTFGSTEAPLLRN
jgi:hypothetical protein